MEPEVSSFEFGYPRPPSPFIYLSVMSYTKAFAYVSRRVLPHFHCSLPCHLWALGQRERAGKWGPGRGRPLPYSFYSSGASAGDGPSGTRSVRRWAMPAFADRKAVGGGPVLPHFGEASQIPATAAHCREPRLQPAGRGWASKQASKAWDRGLWISSIYLSGSLKDGIPSVTCRAPW